MSSTAVIWIVLWILFAFWGSAIARGKNRSPQGWGFACLLTGLIGIVVLLTLPKVER